MNINLKPILATLLCVAMVCAVSTNLWAQSKEEIIQGKVVDQTGGALPGVEILATNVSMGTSRLGVSTDIGNYRIPVNQSGIYRVEASLPGFKTFVITDVEVNVGGVLRLDITLEVGDITETVEVVGESGVTEVQTDTNELSTVISEGVVDRIPVSSRKVIEVVVVAPAVTYRYTDIQPRDGYTPWFSVAGSGPGNHIWKFDGANAHHMRVGGAQVIKTNPPPDVMKQVRVVTNNYSAEFGGGDGALFIMESKSGTNDYHGSLYYYGRNDAVDAKPFFAQEIPPLRKHVYGGFLGGPVIKDKAHFLISLEKEKNVEGLEWIVTVPTALERAGDFSGTKDADGSLRVIYDPDTNVQAADGTWSRTAFAGNVIPEARFDPIAASVIKMYPDPNLAGITNTLANNFTNAVPDITLTRFWQMYRFDFRIGDNDSIYWRSAIEPLDNVIEGPFGSLLDSKSQENRTEEDNHVLGWDRVWSPTFTSSFRSSFMIFRSPRHMSHWRSNWAGQLGLKNLRDDAFPRFRIEEYRTIGQGWYHQHPDIKGQRGATLEGSLVFLRGDHTLKTGVEFMHSRAVWGSRAWPSGDTQFTRNATWNPATSTGGRGGASFLLGHVNWARFEEGPVTDMRGIWISGYIQDDWRIHPDLTLNLGLRYEYDQPKVDMTESHNLFDPDAINPVCDCPGTVTFSRQIFATAKIHTAFYNKEPYRFAPRLGFAWTPGGRQDLVLRGGFGIFYVAPDQGDGFWDTPRLGIALDGVWQTNDNGLTPAFLLATEGFPLVEAEAMTPGFGAVAINTDANNDGVPEIDPRMRVGWFAPHRPTKYRQLYNFSVQKRMGDLVAEIGYLGNIARKMPTRIELNQLHPDNYAAVKADPVAKQSLVMFPQFSSVGVQGSGSLSTTYHAALLLLRGRVGRDLNFQTNYTIARHLGDSAGYRGIYRIDDSYGPVGLEVRHRWVWSGVWDLPFGPGKDYLSSGGAASLLGGWSLGFIINIQSRSPGSVSAASNSFDTGGPNQRPDRIAADLGIKSKGFNPGTDRWFDETAFALVPGDELRLGDAGPGIIHNPYRTSFDFSLFKRFQASEGAHAELRLDFFNAFNNTNWNGANGSIGGTSTGVISSSERARIIEYSMRIVW